jgi:hypothetical protein
VELTVSLDTNYTTIGTPIYYSINVNYPKDKIIKFSNWSLYDPIEIRSSTFDNPKYNSSWSLSRENSGKIEIVFWDTGRVVIPGYKIDVLNPDSSFSYFMISDSMIVNVISITEKDPTLLASAGQIMPIKDPVPVKIPLPWTEIILIFLLISTIIGIFIVYRKRIKSKVDYTKRPVYLEYPDIVAMDKLEKLVNLNLVDEENIKEFYVKLSHILREYTENSLFIKTLEMTTEEIKSNRELLPFSDNCIESYLNILSTADMAKYAKYYNDADQCKSDLIHSKNFVQDTIQYWKVSFSE